MTIPYRERGYSYELDTFIVHERYQDHAPHAVRTRSMLGIVNREVQTGEKPQPCEVCFPEPKRPGRIRRWEKPAYPAGTFGADRGVTTTETTASITTEPEPDSTTEAAGE